MERRPLLLGEPVDALLQRMGFNLDTRATEEVEKSVSHFAPSILRDFPSPDVQAASKTSAAIQDRVDDIRMGVEDALSRFVRAWLTLARKLHGETAFPSKVADTPPIVEEFERRMARLAARAQGIETEILSAKVDRVERQTQAAQEQVTRLGEAALLGLTERMRAERASSLRIMVAVAAATTALLAATFQEPARDPWYDWGAWGTFGFGVVVVMMVWAHSLRAAALAKREVQNYNELTLEDFIKQGKHVPHAAWLWGVALALVVQLGFAALALASSVLS